jgi:ribose 5-phosphate isomerase B
MKKSAIGCDPNATVLKGEITKLITEMGFSVTDFGSEDPIYANVAIDVAEAVAKGKFDRGILLCGTGIGVCMAANKVKGAYAALCSDIYSTERSILSNNSNIMTMGEQVTGISLAKKMVETWLELEYIPGGRSEVKIQRISDYAASH